MIKFRLILASMILTCALAASAAADGIIHTGSPAPQPPPPPAPTSFAGDPAEDEETDGPSAVELATAAALDLLRQALSLF